MTENQKIVTQLEAVLFACGEPMEIDRIAEALETDRSAIRGAVTRLNEDYRKRSGALQILELGDRLQLTTCPQHADIIRHAMEIRRNQPLSQAAFEVLSVVAYNQPVTKAFIEQVRGVDCSGVIAGLCEKNLIEESGRLDLPGRPLLYATTPDFLRCFGLRDLSELPPIPREEEPEESADTAAVNDAEQPREE